MLERRLISSGGIGMVVVSADKLETLIKTMFVQAGSGDEEAGAVSFNLVEANLKGHDSHGVGLVPRYIQNCQNKVLTPNAHMSVEEDKGVVLQMTGNMGYGQVVGKEATEFAISRTQEYGVCVAGLRNSHHLGRIGAWGEMCAEAGLVSIHYVNVIGHQPLVAPYGGAEGRYATNPYCTAIPAPPDGEPIILDMATSKVAMGKVRVAYNKGEDMPDDCLINPNGAKTNDPGVMFREQIGALLPVGDHKGSGLALIAEILAGALVNGGTCVPDNQKTGTIHNNMLSIIMNPAALGNVDYFRSELSGITEYVKSARPAQGVEKVLVPGDPERQSMVKRGAKGIPIDEQTWQEIITSAGSVGILEPVALELAGQARQVAS